MFIGWGSQPYFSEFSAGGKLLFDAHMHGSYESYRGYRFAWTGAPAGTPAIAAAKASGGKRDGLRELERRHAHGELARAGRQLGDTLAPVASAPRSGFETHVVAPRTAPYIAVQALDACGAVIGTSHAIRD